MSRSGHLLFAHIDPDPHGGNRHNFKSMPQRQDDLKQGSIDLVTRSSDI